MKILSFIRAFSIRSLFCQSVKNGCANFTMFEILLQFDAYQRYRRHRLWGSFSSLRVFVSATTSPIDENFMANAMIFFICRRLCSNSDSVFLIPVPMPFFCIFASLPSYAAAAAFCSPLHNISLYLSLSSFRIQIFPFSLYLFSFFLLFQQCSRCVCTLLFHSFSAVSYPLDEIIGMLAKHSI